MLSFHNDPKIKKKYLDRVKLHQKLDQEIQCGGFINPEVQKTYVSGTVPDSWCGGTTASDYKEVKWKQ